MGAFLCGFRWMYCNLRRRERKDQPAVSRIHMIEPENITEELAVSFGVCAVEDDVSPRN